MGYKKLDKQPQRTAQEREQEEGCCPSPSTASSPSLLLPTSAPSRRPAPFGPHAYLPPRATAVTAPETISHPCQVTASPRFPSTICAPRLDSRPLSELRSQQHILPQPCRVHGQHRHDVAPMQDSRGAVLCSRPAPGFSSCFPRAGEEPLVLFFSKPPVGPCLFSWVVFTRGPSTI